MKEGKQKDSKMEFYTDRRADRRLAQALQLASTMQPDTPDPSPQATLPELLEYCAQAEATFDQLAPIQESAMPDYPDI